MRREDLRQSIVEEAPWLVAVAEWTVANRTPSIHQIQTSPVCRRKSISQLFVQNRKRPVWACSSYSFPEHIRGRLDARFRIQDDVLEREGVEGIDDSNDRREEEDVECYTHAAGHGSTEGGMGAGVGMVFAEGRDHVGEGEWGDCEEDGFEGLEVCHVGSMVEVR